MRGWYSLTTRRCYEKKTGLFLILVIAALFLAACQANYIRDVQGGTVAPSSSSELTGLAVQ
ncbi:colicin release lysis protein [Salmonella enterica]|uniref:colicin release lysis protein n=1 Tax=Salmonella enterica TaxID=28901 RepID=UPI0025414957|nr:colicin release lysis protein [Salmonella enterica]WIF48622.1 colicin release lysis protein [Salmonella enterica subsp. enterica]WIF48623.1 colicin release lysis protein [Salmonella enterica subsp. enterica]